MRAFSQLLDDLVYTRSRNTKLKLIGDYLKETPDPDRGYGARGADRRRSTSRAVKPAAIRGDRRGADRPGPVLHEPRLCRRHGRDGVAAVAQAARASRPRSTTRPSASATAIERLRSAPKLDAPRALAAMLDHLDASGRFALLKLAHRRASRRDQRAARQAGAGRRRSGSTSMRSRRSGTGSKPPFAELFDWAEGRGEQPTARDVPVFRPFMLAHPLEETRVSLDDYAAEWKWDGIRVQLVHAGGETRLYSRTGDDISGSFPDVAEAFRTDGVLDGELLVRGRDQGADAARRRGGELQRAPAAARPQERHARRCCGDYPAFVRLYDILFDGDEDLRALPWSERRERLERFARAARSRAVRRLAADRGGQLRGARGAARRRPRRRDRGHHAQAPRQPLCRRAAAPACGTNGSATR